VNILPDAEKKFSGHNKTWGALPSNAPHRGYGPGSHHLGISDAIILTALSTQRTIQYLKQQSCSMLWIPNCLSHVAQRFVSDNKQGYLELGVLDTLIIKQKQF